MASNILIVSDNVLIAERIDRLTTELGLRELHRIDYACSAGSPLLSNRRLSFAVRVIDVKGEHLALATEYAVIISAHCKQLFPAELVRRVCCVNVHPGLNPHNRGWYPQVFSIINKRPLGATLHVMDEHLDHGPIIAQKPVPLHAWDTSLSAYNRVLDAEVELLREHLASICTRSFVARPADSDGNVNLKRDFARLCDLDLGDTNTLATHLDRLRALSHGEFKNAYFIDPASGRKIYVRIELSPEL